MAPIMAWMWSWLMPQTAKRIWCLGASTGRAASVSACAAPGANAAAITLSRNSRRPVIASSVVTAALLRPLLAHLPVQQALQIAALDLGDVASRIALHMHVGDVGGIAAPHHEVGAEFLDHAADEEDQAFINRLVLG